MMTRRKPRSLPLQGSIVGQQISVAAAQPVWDRAHAQAGSDNVHGWFVLGRAKSTTSVPLALRPGSGQAASVTPTHTADRDRSCHWFAPRKGP